LNVFIFVLTNTNDLRLCRTWGQAKPILEKLRAGVAATELAHKSILLKETNDPTQRNYGDEFMEKAIKDIENNLQENLLPHTNTGARNIGSNAASAFSNYPQPATISQDGQHGMTNMHDTQDQWKARMIKSLSEYIDKTMVKPRDRKLEDKDRIIENLQREIKYLNRINETQQPVNHIDNTSTILSGLREVEQRPRKSSIVVDPNDWKYMKPYLDMTPTHRNQQTKEEIQNSILAEDRELATRNGYGRNFIEPTNMTPTTLTRIAETKQDIKRSMMIEDEMLTAQSK